MKQLSRERLEFIRKRAATSSEYIYRLKAAEVEAMASLLLAGMAQEPAATVFRKGDNVTVIMIGVDLPEGHTDVYTNAAPPAPVVAEPVSLPYKFPDGIPDRIWLNTAGEWPADGTAGEVTWCRDQQHDLDTLYVRADAWIPCGERMPEPNIYVLVSNGVWVGQGLYNDAIHLEEDERWQDEHQEFIDLLHFPVTHWQPLPALPQR